jgi:hypothetical protein
VLNREEQGKYEALRFNSSFEADGQSRARGEV